MQNDDYGKDYFNGFKQGLGKEADKIVKLATYEVADPTVDLQIIQLKDTGANVFFNITTPKFAAQAIKKMAELGWKPAHYINNVSSSAGTVMKPAGYENSQGIITAYYLKDPTDRDGCCSAFRSTSLGEMSGSLPTSLRSRNQHVASGLREQMSGQTADGHGCGQS